MINLFFIVCYKPGYMNTNMIRFSFFTLILLILGTACGNGLIQVEQKDEFGNTIKYTKNPETGALDGTWVRMGPDNKKLEEAEYNGGTLNGKRTLFYENGQAEIVETYVDGVFEGSFLMYYENGQLKQEGNYKNGETVGEWKGFYQSGQLKEIVTFAKNAENGPFTEYHENGQLKTEGNYLNGDNEDGLLKEYDETGTLVTKKDCKMGICKTIWKKETNGN